MGVSVWQLLILLGGAFIFLVPCIAALLSKKIKGWDKFFWFVASVAFSWLGYLAYYFARVRKPADSQELGRIHVTNNR